MATRKASHAPAGKKEVTKKAPPALGELAPPFGELTPAPGKSPLSQFTIAPGTIVGTVSSTEKAQVSDPLTVAAIKILPSPKIPNKPRPTKEAKIGVTTLGAVPTASKKGRFTRGFDIKNLPTGTMFFVRATAPDGEEENSDPIVLDKTEGQQIKLSFD